VIGAQQQIKSLSQVGS